MFPQTPKHAIAYPATQGTWTVNGGEYIYLLDPNFKTLTLSGSALGGAGNSLTLSNVADIAAAAARYGIVLNSQAKTTLTGSTGAQSDTIGEYGAIGVLLNAFIQAGDTVKLIIDSVSGISQNLLKLVTGDQILDFSSGSITLNPAAGQNALSLAILEQGDLSANASVTFKAVIEHTDANGLITTSTSNLYTLGIGDTSDPVTDPTTTPFSLPGAFQGTIEHIGGATGNYLINYYDRRTTYTTYDGTELQNTYGSDTAGNDAITTGAGRDYIGFFWWANAGAGDDLINSGAGQDRIYAGNGRNTLIGGSDDDRLYANTKMTVEQAITSGNTDTNLNFKSDWLSGKSGDDTLIGSAAIDLLFGGAGDDIIGGDTASESVYFYIDPVTHHFLINGQSYDWTITQPTPYTRIVTGSTDENDKTSPDGAADVIYAGNGNDFAVGAQGNDTIFGEAGDDILWGDDIGMQGNDYLDGGAGDDFSYNLCLAINIFNALLIRVCQPRPCDFKCSSTSASTRMDTITLVRAALLPAGRPRMGLICFSSALLNAYVSASAAIPALIAASSAGLGTYKLRFNVDIVFHLSRISLSQADNAATNHMLDIIAINKHHTIQTVVKGRITNDAQFTIVGPLINLGIQPLPLQKIGQLQRNAMLGKITGIFCRIINNIHGINVYANNCQVKPIIEIINTADDDFLQRQKCEAANEFEWGMAA